jgi:hypothetical protein
MTKSSTQREESAKPTATEPDCGRPATWAARAVKKDLVVRVRIAPIVWPETEDLREEGYGHGV